MSVCNTLLGSEDRLPSSRRHRAGLRTHGATQGRIAPGCPSTEAEADVELGVREAKAIEQRATDSRLAQPTLCERERTALDRDAVVLSPQRGTFASLHNGSVFSGMRRSAEQPRDTLDSRDSTTSRLDRSPSMSVCNTLLDRVGWNEQNLLAHRGPGLPR